MTITFKIGEGFQAPQLQYRESIQIHNASQNVISKFFYQPQPLLKMSNVEHKICQKDKPFSDRNTWKNVLLLDSKVITCLHWQILKHNFTAKLNDSEPLSIKLEYSKTQQERYKNGIEKKLVSNRCKLQKSWWYLKK